MNRYGAIQQSHDRFYSDFSTFALFNDLRADAYGSRFSFLDGQYSYVPTEVLDAAVERSFAAVPSDKFVVDLGCGTGVLSGYLHRRLGCPVLGVDMSEVAIASAYVARSSHDLSFVVSNQECLPLASHAASLVVSVDSAQCSLDQRKLVQEVARVLKPHKPFIATLLVGENSDLLEETKDPFFRALQEAKFCQIEKINIDPGLDARFRFFSLVYKYRSSVISQCGQFAFNVLMSEAARLAKLRDRLAHVCITCRKVG